MSLRNNLKFLLKNIPNEIITNKMDNNSISKISIENLPIDNNTNSTPLRSNSLGKLKNLAGKGILFINYNFKKTFFKYSNFPYTRRTMHKSS